MPALPPGFLPVSLFPDAAKSLGGLKIALVVRKDPDPVAGHFITLRTLLDAVVYLGCIIDAGNKLHGYTEIWVQSLTGIAGSPAAAREAMSNHSLDERWLKIYNALDALDLN